jgi:ubiquinone/menaquinone biosynthesis C-methylase UbiE
VVEGSPVSESWYESAFGPLYPIVYAHRTVEAAKPEAAAAAAWLGLGGADRLLDVACGTGRHLAHLAGKAGAAVGLDYSMPLLERAKPLLMGSALLIRGDMRALPFADASFSALTSFFTSFGYFHEGGENQRTLGEMARVLQPGGRLLMDHACKAYTVQNLEPRTERTQEGVHILEQRWLTEGATRINKHTRVRLPGGRAHEHHESVQLYEPEELSALFETAGLSVERIFGGFDGTELSAQRPRMILLARRTGP